MDSDRIIREYVDAWNRHDVNALLEMCSPNAWYFSTFWMEHCPGEEFEEFFRESFEDEHYHYEIVGEPIRMPNGVTFRYSAHDARGPEPGPAVFDGAEMLQIQDGKITAITDYYWIPDPEVLAEVARVTMGRRGLPRRVKYGLPARRASQFRSSIARLMDHEKLFLDPNLTLSQVADELGCPVNQLTEVISTHYGVNFYSLVDQHRVNYARELLLEKSDDPDYLHQVAAEAGFRSFEKFHQSFKKFFDVTPAEYRRTHAD